MAELKQNEVFAGRYLLCELIGEGGFSEVWMARDQMAHEAVVAIKIYAPNKGLDEYSLRQSRNEFSLTHNLSHPHLLKVNHFDVADGSPYLIMSYCPFGSLAQLLRKDGVLSERQIALLMCQIGSVLEEIHHQDPPIIHQDIKPDNILLLQPDTFMLADFGISSRIRQTLTKKSAEAHALTIAYAPPERFDRHPTADPGSDIFSLGVTLYEMCTNTLPWEGAGGLCLLKGACVPALPAPYSPALSAILEACMSADRSKRPTAAEIQQKGRHFLETGQWHSPLKKQLPLFLGKALSSYKAAAAIGLLAVAGLGFYQIQHQNGEQPSQALTTSSAVEKKLIKAGEHSSSPSVAKPSAVPKAAPALKKKSGSDKVIERHREGKQAEAQQAAAVKPVSQSEPKKISRSPSKSKSTYTIKAKKARKPLFKPKTKKAKKLKPKHKWLKKLKRRFS